MNRMAAVRRYLINILSYMQTIPRLYFGGLNSYQDVGGILPV